MQRTNHTAFVVDVEEAATAMQSALKVAMTFLKCVYHNRLAVGQHLPKNTGKYHKGHFTFEQ